MLAAENLEMKKEIENIDFFIWLFSRYEGRTAEEIVNEYKKRKQELLNRYKEASDLDYYTN